ncbi:ATP-binding cassette sub-family G member 3-like [Onychomys torridus]|uniref:ATP-binding cassette sub-family G member 3-like n=1 Tax=Onychomys torridus TaxID=38674 RepID=UPI00167F5C83|nr:ATP-binding cassette sub-family G member 3-like [Onychomys torridus]
MYFTIMMLAYSASSVALFIGAGEKTAAISTVLVVIYFMLMLFISGLSLFYTNFLQNISWMQYVSIPHYGFTALQHSEFLGQSFCTEHNTAEVSRCHSYVICTGEEFLIIQGIDLSSWGFWKNHAALSCIMIIFLSLTYVQLLSLKKKRHFEISLPLSLN